MSNERTYIDQRAGTSEIEATPMDGSGSGNESDSESDISEGARAARDRLAPKTQEDYGSHLNGLTQFALNHRAQFSDCILNDTIVLPVRLALGKAYLSNLRDTLIEWPLDPRPVPERTCFKHYSTAKINGVIGGIKYSFTKVSCPIPDADTKFYSDFQHSFKNIIAQAKAIGAYPATGGAVPLTMLAMINCSKAHAATPVSWANTRAIVLAAPQCNPTALPEGLASSMKALLQLHWQHTVQQRKAFAHNTRNKFQRLARANAIVWFHCITSTMYDARCTMTMTMNDDDER